MRLQMMIEVLAWLAIVGSITQGMIITIGMVYNWKYARQERAEDEVHRISTLDFK